MLEHIPSIIIKYHNLAIQMYKAVVACQSKNISRA